MSINSKKDFKGLDEDLYLIHSIEEAKEVIENGTVPKEYAEIFVKALLPEEGKQKNTFKKRIQKIFKKTPMMKEKLLTMNDGRVLGITELEAKYLAEALTMMKQTEEEKGVESEESDLEDNKEAK